MPTVSVSRELLAPLDDVWTFVAEPHNFPNWWPRVGGVQPDRLGLAPGARWGMQGENRPSFRLEVELTLEPSGEDRTRAELRVQGPWLVGLSRALPREALFRLHALCQTGAA